MLRQMNESLPEDDWHCGGWEGAQRETWRQMIGLSFDERLAWLEEAQNVIAAMHGEEAALLPAGSIISPKKPPVAQ